jgi:protein-disulfide isomerase
MKSRFALLVLLGALAGAAIAQEPPALRPPAGFKLAIVVFEDLECPSCAAAESLLVNTANTYNVPLVRRDLPIPNHMWSFEAHVNARYLDSRSLAIGEEYRHWIFANQPSITKQNLRGMTERFAEEHRVPLPANVDPSGELTAKVRADFELGKSLGIHTTPTIFLVTEKQFVMVEKRNELPQAVALMKKQIEAESHAKKQ